MNEDIVAIFIPITAIVMSLGIPIIYQILDYRRRRDVVEAHHKERMAAIERGMDLPALPEAFYGPLDRNKRPRHLLTGMIWFFIGVALFLALGAVAGEGVRFFGLIPAGVGLAFLIYYFIEGRHEVEAFKAKEAARDAAAPKV
ncbi:MAG: hypothetical protein RL261_1758 [Pseudomonadota bacterium]|jgi:hypothetical protein